MIKNLLYSLFLHFLLLLSIYISFNLKTPKKTNDSEVFISLVKMPLYKPPTNKKKNPPKANIKPKEIFDKKKIKKKIKKALQKIKEVKKTEVVPEKKPKKKPKKKTRKKVKSKKRLKPFKQKELKTVKKTVKEKDNVPEKKQEEKPSKKVAEKATELENLDLSAREKLNMRSQLKRCYSRAIREADFSSKTMISIVIQIDEYGYIESNLDTILDEKRYNDPEESSYKLAVDNIRRTINLCSPLRNLPTDKYDIWKKITLDFGSIRKK